MKITSNYILRNSEKLKTYGTIPENGRAFVIFENSDGKVYCNSIASMLNFKFEWL